MGVLAYEPHVVMHVMHVDMLQQRLYTWQLLQTATSRVLHRICRPYITHSAKSQHPPEASWFCHGHEESTYSLICQYMHGPHYSCELRSWSRRLAPASSGSSPNIWPVYKAEPEIPSSQQSNQIATTTAPQTIEPRHIQERVVSLLVPKIDCSVSFIKELKPSSKRITFDRHKLHVLSYI